MSLGYSSKPTDILTCFEHSFHTSEPRRMEAHLLTDHPGVLEKVRADAEVSEKSAARLPLQIDIGARRVFVGNEEVVLTHSEYTILATLAESPNAVTRDQLLDALGWKGEGFDTRTVDAHVYRLRKKVGAEHVVAIPRFGYRLGPDAAVSKPSKPDTRAEAEHGLFCPNCQARLSGYIDLVIAK